MKKIYLLFVMLTLALGVFAQSKGKNAMTLRLVDIKVTDGTLVNIAKEQEAKGNTKPMDMIRIYEGNVRAKLDEVAKASVLRYPMKTHWKPSHGMQRPACL